MPRNHKYRERGKGLNRSYCQVEQVSKRSRAEQRQPVRNEVKMEDEMTFLREKWYINLMISDKTIAIFPYEKKDNESNVYLATVSALLLPCHDEMEKKRGKERE